MLMWYKRPKDKILQTKKQDMLVSVNDTDQEHGELVVVGTSLFHY